MKPIYQHETKDELLDAIPLDDRQQRELRSLLGNESFKMRRLPVLLVQEADKENALIMLREFHENNRKNLDG